MPDITIPVAGDEIVAGWGSQVAANVNGMAHPIGVECPNAAAVNLANGEIFVAAPVAGSDPSGFYVAATKRLTIPAALGGLYVWTLAGSCVGGTSGNLRRLTLTLGGIGYGGAALVGQAGNSMSWLLAGASVMPGGTAIVLSAQAITSNADFAITRASLYRIGLSG